MRLRDIVALTVLGLGGCAANSDYWRGDDIPQAEPVKIQENYKDMGYTEVIRRVQTPNGARDYILRYLRPRERDNGRHYYSFRQIHNGFPVDCTEGAVAAAALLSDNGYPPYIMHIKEKRTEKSSHVLYIYKENGKFGSLGINFSDNNAPQFETLEGLARYIAGGLNMQYDGYKIADLRFFFPDYIWGEERSEIDILPF